MSWGWAIRVGSTRLRHAMTGRCAHWKPGRVEGVVHYADVVRFVVVASLSAMEQAKLVHQLVHRYPSPRLQRKGDAGVGEEAQGDNRVVTIDLGAAKLPEKWWRTTT